jgi:fatty-acid peroxygenase
MTKGLRLVHLSWSEIMHDIRMLLVHHDFDQRAGLLQPRSQTARDLAAIVDGFGVPGPAMLRAAVARIRCQRWARPVIRRARRQIIPGRPFTTPVGVVATATDLDGYPLPLNTAATELLNLLRPTVAVAWLAAFGALALHQHPDWRRRLADEEPPGSGSPAGPVARACAHETRRWAPFVPLLAAKAAMDLDLPQGRVRRGERVILDVQGTDHDPRNWPDPFTFDPDRFLPDDAPAHQDRFVAQGGGDPVTGHRCPGEPLAVELLAHTLHRLSRLPTTLPKQNLTYPLDRMPTRPVSGVRLQLRPEIGPR